MLHDTNILAKAHAGSEGAVVFLLEQTRSVSWLDIVKGN